MADQIFEDRFDEARMELARNAIAVLRRELTNADRALAWLLWQAPGREVTITSLTMREMPDDLRIASAQDPLADHMKLWLQGADGVDLT